MTSGRGMPLKAGLDKESGVLGWMGLIREKLTVTKGSTITMNAMVMNLEKLLHLF